MRTSHFLLILFALVPSYSGGATIVTNSNIEFIAEERWRVPTVSYRITVDQNPDGNYTSSWWTFSEDQFVTPWPDEFPPLADPPYTLRLVTYNVDESADWFLVEPGQAFTRQGIANGDYINMMGNSWPPIPPKIEFASDLYLGLNTGVWYTGDERDSLGWVHLRVVDGALVMVENVMAYQTPGIIVGTTTIVPEPSGVSLALGGLLILWRARKRITPTTHIGEFNQR